MFFAALGCKKDNGDTVVDAPVVLGTSLPGTWELRTSISGNTGRATAYSPGNGNTIVFTTDHYQTFSAGALVKQGTYKIMQQYSIIQKQNVNTLVYDGVVGNILELFDLNGNTLSFSVDAVDTPSSIYGRIK